MPLTEDPKRVLLRDRLGRRLGKWSPAPREYGLS